jgi:thiol:disulfide interchange protein DsbD
MLDFYADWCVSCKEMEHQTFNDPAVHKALEQVVLLQADVTANDAEDKALLKHFGIFGPPSIMFFGPDGEERRAFRVVGYLDPQEFTAHVAQALHAQSL